MARRYLFTDEAGNFDFSGNRGATRYFSLTTVTLDDCAVGDALLHLRRDLAWDGHDLCDEFHATEDSQAVRDRVFDVLRAHQLRIDSTIFEKAKAYSYVRADEERFYRTACFFHFKHVLKQVADANDELLVVGASLGTKKKRQNFYDAFRDVVRQCLPRATHQAAYWASSCEPCLQVADYCSWAVQRKWERGDDRSYVLIQDKIASEFDIWKLAKVAAEK